jgi:hypothetical protein
VKGGVERREMTPPAAADAAILFPSLHSRVALDQMFFFRWPILLYRLESLLPLYFFVVFNFPSFLSTFSFFYFGLQPALSVPWGVNKRSRK